MIANPTPQSLDTGTGSMPRHAAADRLAGVETPDARPVLVYLQKGEALGDSIIHIATYRAARLAFPRHRIIHLCTYASVYATPTMAPIAHKVFDEVRTMQPINRGPLPLMRALAGLGPLDVVIEFRSNLNALWSYLASWRSRQYIANVAGYVLRRGVGHELLMRPDSNAARFHRLIEIAAGRRLPLETRFAEMPASVAKATELLPSGPRYLGLVPGPSVSIKSWPLERFVELAEKVSKLDLQPVVLLGMGEASEEAKLRQLLPDAILIGPSSIPNPSENLAWVIHAVAARLTACIAVEGGIGHLVATQSVPLLTLEGPTNAQRWRPVTPHWWLLRARDFGSRRTQAIPVQSVLHSLEEMLRWGDTVRQGNDSTNRATAGEVFP